MTNWPPIMTALITPYDERGRVNPAKAAELAQHLWGQGSGGFVVAGSTGEAYALSLSERRQLFEAVRAAVPNEAPVWVGTGHNDTREAQALTRAADQWGADGMLVVAPYYNKPPAEALAAHFAAVAAETGRPVMIYDVPSRTGVQVAPEVVLAAASDQPNIQAVKEAAGTITALIAMHRAVSPRIRVYSGDDALFLPALAVGAAGVVSVASHVAAKVMSRIYDAFQSGDNADALALSEELWPLSQELFRQSNPIPLKWLLNRLGWSVGGVRAPLAMLPDDQFAALWHAYSLTEEPSARRA